MQVLGIDEPVRVDAVLGQRQGGQPDQASLAQGVGGQHLAHERDAQILLGRLQHQPGIVESGHRIHTYPQSRQRKPSFPHRGAAQQGLVRQRLRVGAEQPLRGLGRAHRYPRRMDQALGVQAAPLASALTKRGVKPFALQVDDLLRRVQLDADVRMSRMPVAHARQQPALRKGRQHAHAHALMGSRRGGCRGTQAVVDLVQRGFHRTQQRGTGGVEHDALCTAIEQLHAELRLELAQLLTDGAVRQVQFFGRGAQVAGARDGAESGQGLQRNASHDGQFC